MTPDKLKIDLVGDKVLLSSPFSTYELERLPIALLNGILSGHLSEAWQGELDSLPAEDYACGELEALQRSPTFADYSLSDVYERDLEKTKTVAMVDPMPSSHLPFESCPSKNMSVAEADDFLANFGARNVGSLLDLIFGGTPAGDFWGYPSHFRSYPSIGCRHGLEIAIAVQSHEGSHILLAYDTLEHEFKVFSTRLIQETQFTVTLNFYVVWNRYQWRYRHAWYLRAVLLELGHMLSSIRMIAPERGVNLTDFSFNTKSAILEPHDFGFWREPFCQLEVVANPSTAG
jgi:hypothetical protein